MNKILIPFIVIILILFSCKHESLISASPAEVDCLNGVVAYENTVQVIFDANCNLSGCHNAQSARSGVVLEDYNRAIASGGIVANDAAASNLYQRISTTGASIMPPASSGLSLSTDEMENIKSWIELGANYTVCDDNGDANPNTDCDSIQVSFSSQIMPMLQASCVNCHSGSTADGAVWLNNYDDVKFWADNGALLGSIRYESNFTNMPLGSSQWDECKIATVANWIKEGTLNN